MRELLRGVAACPGTVTGRVRLADPTRALDLHEGEILVVPYTTPMISTALARAAALVTEFGGPTSHAGVIVRELGIPAVLHTQSACRILKEGQRVTVDGTKGVVYVAE